MNKNHYSEEFRKYATDFKTKKLLDRHIVNSDEVEKKYVLYARKSTKSKDKQQKSIEDQIIECQEFAKKENITILNKYIDRQTAMKSDKRVEYSKMMKAIKQGKYNAILSWHPDRLARNMKEGGEIINLLDEGVLADLKFSSFTFVNNGSGKVTLGIQFVLAKNYSDNLSVNTERGNKRRYMEGKGLKSEKYGYILNKEKYFRPDGVNFELIRNSFDMAFRGDSLDDIAEYLNNEGLQLNGSFKKRTKQQISTMLADTFYAGTLVAGNGVYDLTKLDTGFIPCVSEEKFMQIRQLYFNKNKFKGNTNKSTVSILLKSLLTCKYCGKSMYTSKTANGKGHRYLWIRCANKDCPRKKLNIRRGMRSNVVFDWMFKYIKSLNITKEDYEQWIKEVKIYRNENRPRYERRLKSLKQQCNKKEAEQKELAKTMTNFMSNQSLSENLQEDINKVGNEIDELKTEYTEVQVQLAECIRDTDKNIWTYERFVNFFKNLRAIIKKREKEALLDKVTNMVFVNLVLGDQEVVEWQVKAPFDTIEKVVTVKNGVSY